MSDKDQPCSVDKERVIKDQFGINDGATPLKVADQDQLMTPEEVHEDMVNLFGRWKDICDKYPGCSISLSGNLYIASKC